MSRGADLEHGYRRLLACYPRRFRDERGEELLAVLLTSARDGQHRPGLIESADLVRNGLGMRLRPDTSPFARRGWSDALAIYSLTGPVLLLLITVTGPLLRSALSLRPVAVMPAVLPGLCLMLASEAVIIALVRAGRRKTALAALVPMVAFPWLAAGWIPALMPEVVSNLWAIFSVYLLEAAALIASPGPRHGRRLVHWGHWAVLLPAAAAAQACMFVSFRGQGSLVTLGVMVIIILALNRLGRALQLSRHFRLLLAATFWPAIFGTAAWDLGGPRLMNDLGFSLVALMFAGPLLCAVIAMSTAIRVRHRRII
jgi:hypothetical protein